MGPTIRSASLVDYPEVARSSGLDPYKMLERVGLPRSCLRNPDLRISADAVAELLEASASAAQAEDFALRLAQRRGLSNLGPLALIVREQPTVRKAIEVLIQYIALHSDALRPHLEENARVVTISRMLSSKRLRSRQALELAVAMFYRIIQTFLGDAWRPTEVCLRHDAPNHPEVHRRFFGTRVRFDWGYDGIVCKAADLEKAIPASDPVMARYLNPDFHVRRGKALVHSRCKSCPGTGSFRPVTIEAAVEVTKPLKPSMKRVAWRLGEHAGRNASER